MRTLLVVILAVLWIPTIHAQRSEVARTQQARRLFESGNRAFSEGRYRDALGYFAGAHELSARPELLYNVGRAAEEAGERDRALDAYRRYLASAESERREEVELRIRTLEPVADTPVSTAATAATPSAETSEAIMMTNPAQCGASVCTPSQTCVDAVCREINGGDGALLWTLGIGGGVLVVAAVIVVVLVLSVSPHVVPGSDGQVTQTLVEMGRF